MKVELYQMVEDHYGSGEAIHLRRNLEEMHMKMRENLRRKLDKYLDPILEVTSAYKYHCWFSFILDPQYVNEFMDVRILHEIETFDTSTIINKMMPKFCLSSVH